MAEHNNWARQTSLLLSLDLKAWTNSILRFKMIDVLVFHELGFIKLRDKKALRLGFIFARLANGERQSLFLFKAQSMLGGFF